MKYNYYISILFFFIVVLISCSSSHVPNNYKNAILKLKKHLKDLKSVEVTMNNVNDSKKTGTISLKKKLNHFKENKKRWEDALTQLEIVSNELEDTKWYDDAIFCIAIGYIKISMLTNSQNILDNSLSSIAKFHKLGNEYDIESWTKNELRDVLWSDLKFFFSKNISQKQNLDQFFYIAKASLLKNKKNDPNEAIDNYKKAKKISSDSIWGLQAQQEMQHLKEKVKNY